MSKNLAFSLLVAGALFTSCSSEDDSTVSPTLNIPTEYVSVDFNANVVAENTVIDELSTVTSAVNAAESNAQTTTVASIDYPATLSAVTLPNYRNLVTEWLVQLVNSANSADGFQNPGFGNMPVMGQEGGLLGSRLLDEYGLELEQMIQKGSFGAALYNHALTVINGDLTDSAAIDKLVEIHGADITFNPSETTAAATYSRRRSNLTAQTGFFFDIQENLITAKAAIEAGSEFNDVRDAALEDYLMNWEMSNFATVIYYCKATKDQLTAAFALADGPDKDAALGNAMHAYAEGVAFAHGFKGLSNKMITDAEIDSVLANLLVVEGQNPESHRFLNEVDLFSNLDAVIDALQSIYGFTDAEVISFYVNNNP
ncbi:MAG: hypothetical protein HKP48_00535 [Winogradskyella sp.]|uniref:hypothetical protein n=1 Tax=Winogradskyella sp. TaxID=1883156 RepID=UPI0017900095|nr:hypothetical protein [Winogradskyella sp.]MBT8244844.1 hypothetical protein [Winogradskyella sp.]NNK21802.1 hypothetical protein [Winogradskyella sp.]